MFEVVARRSGHEDVCISVNAGENLLEVLQKNGLSVPSPCGGHGTCCKCRVRILSGDAGAMTSEETYLLGADAKKGWRCACRVSVHADLTVNVPVSDVDARVLLDGGAVDVPLCPASRRVCPEVPAPSLNDQRSDVERLCQAAGAKSMAFSALPLASGAVRAPGCLFLFRDELTDCGTEKARNLGVAVDVGTTTMAAYLTDLNTGKLLDRESCLNPQRAYGGDVISRTDYAARSQENLMQLRALVTGAIQSMSRTMLERNNLAEGDVRHIVCVGNTIMMHLLLGLNPQYIAAAPFTPVYSRQTDVPASALGMKLPHAMVTAGPCVAGYVGADTVAAILACDMDVSEEINLMIDVGTNGEIALGNRDRIVCCSAAAGPAFEGAHIHCGSGAAQGAVDSVRMEDGKVVCTVLGHSTPRTICGSGLVDAVAEMKKAEIMDETGRVDPDETPDEYAERVFEFEGKSAFSLDGMGENGVFVTQQDLREVQLAKSAIAAGIQVLLETLQISCKKVAHLYLAGGFGNYIRRESAVEIGLLPQELKDRIVPVGNAAGSGARRMLVSRSEEARAAAIARKAEYIELSARPDFQDKFVENMLFE